MGSARVLVHRHPPVDVVLVIHVQLVPLVPRLLRDVARERGVHVVRVVPVPCAPHERVQVCVIVVLEVAHLLARSVIPLQLALARVATHCALARCLAAKRARRSPPLQYWPPFLSCRGCELSPLL